MVRNAAAGRRGRKRTGALVAAAVITVFLIAPQVAGATGNVTVTVNPPQFDPNDGNYAVFSGSVNNAPSPDSDSGCFQFGDFACQAQFVLYPAGVTANFFLGPELVWGARGSASSQISVTINLSTAPDVVAGTTYNVALWAYDSSGDLWQSGTQAFQWPADKLTLSKVRLGESAAGDSTIRYQLDHGGTPFRGRARVTGAVFDGSRRVGKFTHRVKAGTHTKLLPASIDRQLVDGNRYRVRLDATDSLRRQAHFRDKLKR